MQANDLIELENETLIPLSGRCSDFHTEVRKLERPYRKISESDYLKLMNGSADYYRDSQGKTVTFGNADGGFALMPLQAKFAR